MPTKEIQPPPLPPRVENGGQHLHAKIGAKARTVQHRRLGVGYLLRTNNAPVVLVILEAAEAVGEE